MFYILETNPVATYPHLVACESGSQCGTMEEYLAGDWGVAGSYHTLAYALFSNKACVTQIVPETYQNGTLYRKNRNLLMLVAICYPWG